MNLIDTHAHISYADYADNIEEIIKCATDNGIKKIISIGVDLKSSEECIRLSELFEIVYATCGIHPHEASKAPDRYIYELEDMYKLNKVVGIGEIGLDYYYDYCDRRVQNNIYNEQLELAASINMPSVVHCRDANDDILKGINDFSSGVGVIHCFASTLEFANKILDTGFNISFTGMITFVKELELVVKKIPLEKIMIETDSPYLTPRPNRGKRNEPANVKYIAEKIAEIKNISIDKVADSTTSTAMNLFKKLA